MRRPSPATVISVIALFCSLSGGAVAAKSLIDGSQIKDKSITGRDIKNSSLTGADIRNESLTGADIKNGTIRRADLAPDARGAKGDPGPPGPPGPATGPAGGDLTGNYPSPTIAPGAVGIDKLAPRPVFSGTAAANPPVPENSFTTLLWNPTTNNGFALENGNGRIRVPVDGYYLVNVRVCWPSLVAADRRLETQLMRGVAVSLISRVAGKAPGGGVATCQYISEVLRLSTADPDTLSVEVRHDWSGFSLSFTSSTTLAIHWLGPAS
jgi:hypothetical protein